MRERVSETESERELDEGERVSERERELDEGMA